MRLKCVLHVVAAVSTAFGAGCQMGDTGDTEGAAPLLHSSEYKVLTADGLYQFYMGEAVMSQVAETGSYVPQLQDWYSVITIPAAAITQDVATQPITLSLCDPSNNITLFDHVFIGPDDVAQREATHPVFDPHYETTPAGEFMQTYRSGDPGVYGFAQVVQAADGSLAASAAASFWIELENGARGGGMLLGSPTNHDPHFEDPLLDNDGCTNPHH